MFSVFLTQISGLWEGQTTTEISILCIAAFFTVLAGANVMQDYLPKLMIKFKRQVPIRIEFKENYKKRDIITNDIGESNHIKYFWCFIHNTSTDGIKDVKVDLIYKDNHYRLFFHDGLITNKNIHSDSRERIDLVSAISYPRLKEYIQIINTDEKLFFKIDEGCNFTIKILAKGYSPVSKDFLLKTKKLENNDTIFELKSK